MWLGLSKLFRKFKTEKQPIVEEQPKIEIMEYATYLRQKQLVELYQELTKQIEEAKVIQASCQADCDGSVVPSLDGSDSSMVWANNKIRECEKNIWLILLWTM